MTTNVQKTLDLHLRTLNNIKDKVYIIMTAIDDLNAAVSTLAGNFTTLDTAIQAEITALQNALATGNALAVEAAVANISTVSGNMAKDAQALQASVTAPTTSTTTTTTTP